MIELREATGITQQLLADLLQVPRSTMSLGELGMRGLPAVALQKMVMLWSQVPPTAEANDLPLIADVLADEQIQADEKMAFYKESCRIKAANKQRELDKMTKKYEQSLRLLQALKAYSAALPQNAENASTLNWIDGATSFAQLKLMDNSLAKQQLLSSEIKQLLTVL